MDHEAFDRIARVIGARGTRREALGALLAGSLLGAGGDAEGRRKQRSRGSDRIAAQAASGCANPKPGQNLSHCSFLGQDLRAVNLRGANLSGADFTGADLCGADLRATNLQRTDFMGTNLTRVDLRSTNLSTAHLAGAIFCQTRLPNGSRDNSGCPPDGEVCCSDAECPPGAICNQGSCLGGGCINVTQICDPTSTCCSGAVCTEVSPDFELCVLNCTSDSDCPNANLDCRANSFVCPGLERKCCQRKECSGRADCPSRVCCNGACCQANEVCQPGHGCLQID
jgi:hypothetical protein